MYNLIFDLKTITIGGQFERRFNETDGEDSTSYSGLKIFGDGEVENPSLGDFVGHHNGSLLPDPFSKMFLHDPEVHFAVHQDKPPVLKFQMPDEVKKHHENLCGALKESQYGSIVSLNFSEDAFNDFWKVVELHIASPFTTKVRVFLSQLNFDAEAFLQVKSSNDKHVVIFDAVTFQLVTIPD
ncbi:MAG: hypothetical protein JJ866_16620 [Roseibium sp.]|uniref:hypothetical protein n=1 Tax=Roseibium sp. TaxID=1936156 RepID=UPI001AFCFA93|nr:hypothetical protein [Roseibium sp.]MBO6893568.1 hypothetical protein [Roseibium sp.]